MIKCLPKTLGTALASVIILMLSSSFLVADVKSTKQHLAGAPTSTDNAGAKPQPEKAAKPDQTLGHLFGGIIAYLSKEEGRKCSMNIDSVKNISKTIPAKPKGYKGFYVSKEDADIKIQQIEKQANVSQEKALILLSKANQISSDFDKLLKLFPEIYGEFDLMAKNCRNNTKAVEAEIIKTKEEVKAANKPLLHKIFKK